MCSAADLQPGNDEEVGVVLVEFSLMEGVSNRIVISSLARHLVTSTAPSFWGL